MPKLYCFHIQLTKDSSWTQELGVSLSNVMAYIANYDTVPYCYFKTEY